MMPVIRISDETLERLKAHARPFEDTTPEDVLRNALDALDHVRGKKTVKVAPAKPTPASSASSPTVGRAKLPQREFRAPLLQLLHDKGGRGIVREIREELEPRVAPRLSEADYEPVSTGEPRWWNAVCWERNDCVKEGLLRADSQRGVWELTDLGHVAAGSLAVHWYSLRRMTPKNRPPEKDEWSALDKGPRDALLQLEKTAGLGALELCDEGDHRADFVLEQHVAKRSLDGAVQHSQPGAVINRLYVRAGA
jgi:hypothetical protein